MATLHKITSKTRRRLRWYARVATAPWRPLPDFLVIGAQKSGTSALNAYLKQLPYVCQAIRKEVHYYDRRFDKSVAWYRAHFPLKSQIPKGAATDEGSPYYLAHPHVPKRIANVQPNVKMIVLLRDPKKRALSHYHMSVRKNREELPFEEAVRQEEKRIGEEWKKTLENDGYESVALRYYSYKLRGHYAEQLRRYFQYFDRDQILVLSSGALRHKTIETLAEICSFLGIPEPGPGFVPKPRGTSAYSRNIDPETDRYLDEYFEPLNRDLYELLGKDFGW